MMHSTARYPGAAHSGMPLQSSMMAPRAPFDTLPGGSPSRAKGVHLSKTWLSGYTLPILVFFLLGATILALDQMALPWSPSVLVARGRVVSSPSGSVAIGDAVKTTGDGVSLVVVCMNRHDTLRRVIKNWLAVKNVDEVIVVDWSSDPALYDLTRGVLKKRLLNVRVEGEKSWVLSRAFNVGMQLATKERLLKIDCDYALDQDFVRLHPLDRGTKRFYSGDYGKARNENEVHLNGVLYIRREHFWGIYGYDERIQTYGWDDEDLYVRLANFGLNRTVVDYNAILHYPHGDKARGQLGVKFPQVEVDLNRLLLDKLALWSEKTGASRSQYIIETSRPGQLVLRAQQTPKALRALSDKADVEKSYMLALGRRLHDEYAVPWDILQDMSSRMSEILLREMLLAKSHLPKADAAPTRALVLHVVGGPIERLWSVIQGYTMARRNRRALLVVWDTEDFEATFEDMFDPFVAVLDKMRTKYPFTSAESWDAVWADMYGVDLTLGERELERLKQVDATKSLYIKAVELPLHSSTAEFVPLSVKAQLTYGTLEPTRKMGIVALTVEEFNVIKSVVTGEVEQDPGVKILLVTRDTNVIKALEKLVAPMDIVVGKSRTACKIQKPVTSSCALAVAVDVGALSATSFVVAPKEDMYARTAHALSKVEVHYV